MHRQCLSLKDIDMHAGSSFLPHLKTPTVFAEKSVVLGLEDSVDKALLHKHKELTLDLHNPNKVNLSNTWPEPSRSWRLMGLSV